MTAASAECGVHHERKNYVLQKRMLDLPIPVQRDQGEHKLCRDIQIHMGSTPYEFECVRRALRALNQSGVPEPNDFLRTVLAPTRHRAIHEALPSRAQSSGSG